MNVNVQRHINSNAGEIVMLLKKINIDVKLVEIDPFVVRLYFKPTSYFNSMILVSIFKQATGIDVKNISFEYNAQTSYFKIIIHYR